MAGHSVRALGHGKKHRRQPDAADVQPVLDLSQHLNGRFVKKTVACQAESSVVADTVRSFEKLHHQARTEGKPTAE